MPRQPRNPPIEKGEDEMEQRRGVEEIDIETGEKIGEGPEVIGGRRRDELDMPERGEGEEDVT